MATWWSDLSESSRRLIVAAAIGEAVLKAAVLVDIRRRPASQIRGSKRMWIMAAVLVNSAGIGPLSYFAFGRRRQAEAAELDRGLYRGPSAVDDEGLPGHVAGGAGGQEEQRVDDGLQHTAVVRHAGHGVTTKIIEGTATAARYMRV
jgi:Phospholipase_D-nuclease N-terminal